jgi:hypothetical protein
VTCKGDGDDTALVVAFFEGPWRVGIVDDEPVASLSGQEWEWEWVSCVRTRIACHIPVAPTGRVRAASLRRCGRRYDVARGFIPTPWFSV